MAMRPSRMLAALSLALACASRPQRPPEPAPLRPLTDRVAEFVRAAVADRHQAREIPDQNLLAGQDPVLIFDEMEQSGYKLDEKAIPTTAQARFALIGRTGARDRAYRTGRGLPMIAVDAVEMSADAASLKVGVGMYPDVAARSLIMLCCCSARANYQWRDGAWTFAGWGERICD